MSVQNINNAATPALTPAAPAAPATGTAQAGPAVPVNQAAPSTPDSAGSTEAVRQEGTQTAPAAASQSGNAATQAVLVALEKFIATGLDELTQTLGTRAALLDKLPPAIKELVQNILNQTQAAQTAVPDGLVTLLRSPKLSAEKLALLASVLEESIGLTSKPGEQPATGTTAGKQQALQLLVQAWQDGNVETLKTAAASLRQLAAGTGRAGEQPVAGEASSAATPTPAGQASASSQSMPAPGTPQPGTLPAAGQQTTPPAATSPEGGPDTGNRPATTMPAGQQPASSGAAPLPGNPAAGAQPAENQLPTMAGTQQTQPAPELTQPSGNLPGDMPDQPVTALPSARQIASQEGEPAPGKPSPSMQTGSGAEQAKQPFQPATLARQGNAATATQDPTLPDVTKALAANPELVRNLPPAVKALLPSLLGNQEGAEQALAAWPESIASLLKSAKPAAEKITQLATFLEQAADILKPDGRPSFPGMGNAQAVLPEVEVSEVWQNKSQQEQKAIAQAVRELAESLTKPGNVAVERQERQQVLSFTVPLYFGDGQTAYPAHIHIFHQQQEDKKNPGQQVTETWLRICLETENIGTVETAFRLYDGQTLDVKVRFSDQAAAEDFGESVPDVKTQLGRLPLTLGEFLVR